MQVYMGSINSRPAAIIVNSNLNEIQFAENQIEWRIECDFVGRFDRCAGLVVGGIGCRSLTEILADFLRGLCRQFRVGLEGHGGRVEDHLTLAAAGSGRIHQQTVHPAAVGFHVVHRHVAAAIDFTLTAAAIL